LRWRDDDRVEAARALTALEDASGRRPSEARLERILRNVQIEASVGGRRRPALVGRLAAIALLLGVTGAGVASVARFHDRLLPSQGALDQIVPRELTRRSSGKQAPPPLAAAPPPKPVALAKPAVAAPRAAAAAHHAASPTLAPLDPVAAETALVKAAMSDLRAGDSARALARLDERDRAFPAGVLRREAEMVRVEALVASGRRTEALARLEALPASELSRRLDLRVAKGELLASTNRCEDATGELDQALRANPPAALTERAEYARAVCAARLGRAQEARAGFERLLGRFPAGRFAGEARRALGR
jgi:tetratricopeptide (TPR) repeat protein